MRRLLWLYPSAWRARYGDELAALMEDAPAGRFDVLKGALAMRFRYESGRAILLGFAVLGMLTGLGASYFVAPLWESTAVVQAQPTGLRRPPQLQPGQIMESVITDPHLELYPRERRRMPIVDVVDKMRRNSEFTLLPGKQALFLMEFRYPDPGKVVRAQNMLITMANDLHGLVRFSVVEAPRLSARPIGPDRRRWTAAGVIFGLVGGAVVLLIRRRRSALPPGLAAA